MPLQVVIDIIQECFFKLILQIRIKCLYLQSQSVNGALAERLGTGLQNLLQRFDSARHLQNSLSEI